MTSQFFRQPALLVAGVVLAGAATLAACKIPTPTDNMKKVLSEHGTLSGEWAIRDDAEGKTYTYVLLRTKTGTHETYELIATDGQRKVTRDHVGGIDSNGCYLFDSGMATRWITSLPPEVLEDRRPRRDRTYTACLEYKGTEGWRHIPEKERKAAEPPPPPPPTPSADAGMGGADAGTGGSIDTDEIESAIP